jgi:hypothetical protein
LKAEEKKATQSRSERSSSSICITENKGGSE